MSTKVMARIAVPAVLSAVLAAGWPALGHAATPANLTPDAASSSISYATGSSTLTSAPAHAIRGLSQVTVAFSGTDVPITQSWTDYTTIPSPTQRTSYVCLVAVGGSSCTDQKATTLSGNNALQLTVPAGTPDGTYQIYAVAWPASCASPIPASSCSTNHWAGLVPDSSNPYTFTLDNTAPAAPVVNAPATIDAGSVHAVTISGTAEPGSDVFVTVASSGGGSTLFANPGGTTADPGTGAWTITPNLSSLPDGTLTINATASDVAGNVSSPGSPSPAPVLAARPSAPRSVIAYAGDSGLGVTWLAPASDGGHPLTGYQVGYTDTTAATPAQTVTAGAAATSAVIPNLVNGHAYAVTVRAMNDAGPGAVAAATATPKARTSLYVTSSYNVVTYGHATVLIGRLTRAADGTGVAKEPITVTSRYDNGAAGPTFHATTDEFGYWQLSGVKPARTIRYSATFAGDPTYLPVASPASRVLVRAAVRITKVSAANRSHTTPVRLTGAVSPNERGRHVDVYEVVGRKLVKVATLTLGSSSTWSFSHRWSRGTHYVVVRFLSQNGVVANTSNKVKIVRS